MNRYPAIFHMEKDVEYGRMCFCVTVFYEKTCFYDIMT